MMKIYVQVLSQASMYDVFANLPHLNEDNIFIVNEVEFNQHVANYSQFADARVVTKFLGGKAIYNALIVEL